MVQFYPDRVGGYLTIKGLRDWSRFSTAIIAGAAIGSCIQEFWYQQGEPKIDDLGDVLNFYENANDLTQGFVIATAVSIVIAWGLSKWLQHYSKKHGVQPDLHRPFTE